MNNKFPIHKTSSFISILMRLGSPSQLEPEERHRRIPAVFILMAGALTMVLFTPYHIFSTGNYSIAIADIFTCALMIGALLYLKKREQGILVYWIIGLVFIVFAGITTIIGRGEVSYFLWAFMVPPIIFSVLGKKGGIAMSLLFFLLTLFLMTAPAQIMYAGPYSNFIVGRYIAVYIILTLILYYYETSQQLLFQYIQEEKDKFEHASKHDPLTGLSNRRAMISRLEHERQRQLRLGSCFTLVLGDIDNFKTFNDIYGHDSGDYILKSVGFLIKSQLRNIDSLSRWGGEEFLILLVATETGSARNVAERIRKLIEEAVFSFNDTPLAVTMTFGLSTFQGVEDSIESCIKRADEALYTGKNSGRNQVVVK